MPSSLRHSTLFLCALLVFPAAAHARQEIVSVTSGPVGLAPGRRSWVRVPKFLLKSRTIKADADTTVVAGSSDSSVVTVSADTGDYWAIDAKRLGTARISLRLRGDSARAVQVDVIVRDAPIGDERKITYSATHRLVPSNAYRGTHAALGPMELEVTLTVRNTADSTRDVWLSNCPAWIRIYSTRDRSRPPVKDVPRDVNCGMGEMHVTLAPGEARVFPAGGFRLTIDRDTLPNRRHYVFAVLDRLHDLKEIDAGPVDIVSPNAGLRLRASLERDGAAPRKLRARVTVTNTNASPVRLEYGACSVVWYAYATPERSGKAVWNSMYHGVPRGAEVVCPLYLATATVGQGQTVSPREFNASFEPAKILGDSLRPGRYYFTARIELNWRTQVLNAGSAVLTR